MMSFLNRCGSVIGSRYMRRFLKCPSANFDEITQRQEALLFFCNANNDEFVKALLSSIKKIKNFNRIMKRMNNNGLTVGDWQGLFRTLNGLVQIAQIEENCKSRIPILEDIKKVVT